MKSKYFLLWMAFSLLAIAGISLASWDVNDIPHSALALTASVTGMAYTMLAGRGKIVCYLFGFVNAPLYAYLSWRWGYYGDAVLNAYYFVMMFPGVWFWRKNLRQDAVGEIVRTRLPSKDRVVWAVLVILATLALWSVLRVAGGNRPLCDALTNVLSVAAIILTVKRCIEQWVMWLTVDAVEIVMWWRAGDSSMAILAMWVLFLIDGIYLFWLWCVPSQKDGF